MKCKHHPELEAEHICWHCRAPLCSACYDEAAGGCRGGCPEAAAAKRAQTNSGRSAVWTAVVAIFAIIGAVTVLLLSLCAGMLFLNT